MNKKHRNILKLCSDQHSPFVAGFAGDRLIRTPNLDKLAEQGVVFENHYCSNPVCTPGRYSMLTGRLPRENGTLHFSDILPLQSHTYMKHFSQHGYMTTCVGKMHFHGTEQMYGWMFRPYGDMEVYNSYSIDGYSEEKDVVGGIAAANQRKTLRGGIAHMLKTAGPGTDQFMLFDESVTREAVLHLKNYFLSIIDHKYQGTRPLLFEVSWKTPHCPYVGLPDLFQYYRERIELPAKGVNPMNEKELPDYIQKRRKTDQPAEITDDMILNARAAYYALVEFTDRQVGIVLQALEELGMRDEFTIMYCSDHGEMAGEHGLWQKTCFYEESARVPMILSGPDLPKGRRVRHNTSHIDLFPTLCELADLPLPENIRGESMLPLIDEEQELERVIFSEYFGPTDFFMAKYKDMKYVLYSNGETQLFDLRKDPDEIVNLSDDPAYQEIKRKLHQEIEALPMPTGYQSKNTGGA